MLDWNPIDGVIWNNSLRSLLGNESQECNKPYHSDDLHTNFEWNSWRFRLELGDIMLLQCRFEFWKREVRDICVLDLWDVGKFNEGFSLHTYLTNIINLLLNLSYPRKKPTNLVVSLKKGLSKP